MPRDSNCDYLAFVMWVETKAALGEMIPDQLSNMLTLIRSTNPPWTMCLRSLDQGHFLVDLYIILRRYGDAEGRLRPRFQAN